MPASLARRTRGRARRPAPSARAPRATPPPSVTSSKCVRSAVVRSLASPDPPSRVRIPAATLERFPLEVESARALSAQTPLVADAQREPVRVVALEQQLRRSARDAECVAEARQGDRNERLERLAAAFVEPGRDREAVADAL